MHWRRCGAPSWTTRRARRSRTELRLLAIGRLRRGPEAELFARYTARLRPRLEVTEVAEAVGPAAEIRRRDGAALLAALPGGGFVVALDIGGAAPDSPGLARLLETWRRHGRTLCFVIGGAEGLDGAVLGRAEARLSLGPMTWPHMLARVLLVEQLYRAQTITGGHPYHRG